jgi:hypothetical protein
MVDNMKPEPLVAAFAKAEWAEAKIKDYDAEIRAFFAARPYEITSKANRNGTKEVWKFRLTQKIPQRFSVEAGAILNNLRSPLDQVIAALAFIRTGSEASAAFPFGRTKNEFETALRKQEKLLPVGAGNIIREARPYPRGNGLLWALNHLDRRNKHRPALVPIRTKMLTNLRSIKGTHGYVLRIGSRRGAHLIPAPDARPGKWDMIQPVLAKRPIYRCSGDTEQSWLEFACPYNDMEFLSTTPGAKFEIYIEPTFDIAFSEINGLEGKPVVAVLNDMRHLVERILLTFEKRFFS